MSIRQRMNRIQRTLKPEFCPDCGGKPALIVIGLPDAPFDRPDPCSRCGNDDIVVFSTGVPRSPNDPLPEEESSA